MLLVDHPHLPQARDMEVPALISAARLAPCKCLVRACDCVSRCVGVCVFLAIAGVPESYSDFGVF